MKPHTHEGTLCPEPDGLVGWAEGRLSDAEAAAVEAHLARCRDCREEVAELGDRSTAVPEPDLFARGRAARGGVYRPRLLRSALLIAAATVLVFAGVRTWSDTEQPPTVEVAIADARAELFAPARSADDTVSVEWFLGVRVTEPSHVALVAIDSRGAARPVPLDRSGAFTLDAQPGVELAVGPYPRILDPALDLRVVAALLIAAPEPLPVDWGERWLEPSIEPAGEGAEAWAKALRERGAPRVVVAEL